MNNELVKEKINLIEKKIYNKESIRSQISEEDDYVMDDDISIIEKRIKEKKKLWKN
jgi:hypothetical protein